ncbi:hypothetical protein FSPOR_751 [Fusarium sporotrichioides]|uniref:Uncharacterized protein n=1 Tax=Fusarium sporotrichioides TaxID=5514 RepID=A0A395STY9_FUSSP|nr:hypothetical protein FSPOR_751 [Fusarium sporotrichioides]
MSATRDREAFSFSRSYEFSWQDSNLCFGGEPLGVTRTPDDGFSKVNRGSERAFSESSEPATGLKSQDVLADMRSSVHMVGIGGYIEHMSPTILLGDLEVASTTSSVMSSSLSPLDATDVDTTEPSDPLLEISMYKYAELAVELLMDDFHRPCAPPTSASKEVTQSASDDREGERKEFNGKARAGPKSRKRKALCDDGESEDEDSRDNERKPSDTHKKKKLPRWACPFVKWDPAKYTCNIGPTQLRGIKSHIKNKHWQKYCHTCWRCYSTSKEEVAHRICQGPLYSDPPPGLITEEMRVEIFENQRTVSGLSHEEQWHTIYSVLFPGEERCLNPWVASNFMDRVESHFRRPRSREILERVLSESEFKGAKCKQIIKIIREEYLPRMFQEHDLDPEHFCEVLSHDPQVIENAQSGQIDVVNASKAITERDPLYDASSPSPQEISTSHQFRELKPDYIPMFDPQAPGCEPSLGGNAHNTLLSPTKPEDPLGAVEPRYSEGYFWESFGSPLHENFDNFLYSNPDVDGDYQEYILGTPN